MVVIKWLKYLFTYYPGRGKGLTIMLSTTARSPWHILLADLSEKPLAMSAKVFLLFFSFIATIIVAIELGTGLTVENLSQSLHQGALEFRSDNMILEGLACSAMAVATPGLTQLKCTSCNSWQNGGMGNSVLIIDNKITVDESAVPRWVAESALFSCYLEIHHHTSHVNLN